MKKKYILNQLHMIWKWQKILNYINQTQYENEEKYGKILNQQKTYFSKICSNVNKKVYFLNWDQFESQQNNNIFSKLNSVWKWANNIENLKMNKKYEFV